MAYVKKADRKPAQLVDDQPQPGTLAALKQELNEDELKYVAQLEAAWERVRSPDGPRRTYMGHFETWYELGCGNRQQWPNLIKQLVRISQSPMNDSDQQYEAVVLLATHGATQLFGGLLQ